jgi:hypothetical protein
MRRVRKALIFVAVLTAAAACLLTPQLGSWAPEAELQAAGTSVPPAARPTAPSFTEGVPKHCEALLISERDEGLLPMAAPVAAKLAGERRTVLLAVMKDGARDGVRRLMKHAGASRTLLLRTAAGAPAAGEWVTQPQHHLTIPGDALAAGLEIARRFWGRPEEAIVASEVDGEAGLLGSALAAHRRVPFLLVARAEGGDGLARSLDQMGAKRVTVVVCGGAAPPAWAGRLQQEVKVLDRGEVQAAIVKTLGPESIRNIIVVRAPDGPAAAARASWLAPYLSYARKSAIVVTASAGAKTAEAEVAAFVSARKLRPRTVTVLADHEGIGLRPPDMGARLGEYTVDIEPCSGPGEGGAAAYGVGRIPFQDAARASLLIARGLARERQPGGGVLMAANPRVDQWALLLAETVARLNVEEFRNVRVPVEAHFGVPTTGAEIRGAVGKAGLIIYQGHISDQAIFQGPGPQPDASVQILSTSPPNGPTSPLSMRARYWLSHQAMFLLDEARLSADHVRHEMWPVVGPRLLRGREPQDAKDDRGEGGNRGAVDRGIVDGWAADDDPVPADPPPVRPSDAEGTIADPAPANPSPVELSGSAMVVLQSCSSLFNEATSGAIDSGACGVIGSTTSIHSASGSSYVKAWSDAVVYRGATAGEAMRDARNYFLLLARLKEARGHKQQPKVLRVALSFRLWGDPEAVVLPGVKGKPTRRTIAGRIHGPQVTLLLPRRKLPEARTSKYVVRAFPGSQTAGIVKRLKGKDYRRLMPVYFLRIDCPAGLDLSGWRALARSGDSDKRAVFATDPLGRHVYVVYFPEEEKSREKITLRFHP